GIEDLCEQSLGLRLMIGPRRFHQRDRARERPAIAVADGARKLVDVGGGGHGQKFRHPAPSPACGGRLGWGRFRKKAFAKFARALLRRDPHPTLPRKRGRERNSPVARIAHATPLRPISRYFSRRRARSAAGSSSESESISRRIAAPSASIAASRSRCAPPIG